jgi:predicted dehydrogenase
MMVDACEAGKDVYVEKPLSLTVVEGRRMVAAAERTKRVVQVGTQRRSAASAREAAEFVRSGGIGRVTVAKAYHIQNEWPSGIGTPPDGDPPDPQQWDQWLGPAPMVRYNPNRMFYKFRWFYNYSGGQLTNFGVHDIDMLRWCLGIGGPQSVVAMGGKYAVEDNREIPDTLEVLWQCEGPTLMTFAQYDCNGAKPNARGTDLELRGTKGTMYIMGNRWEVVPEAVADKASFARSPVDRAGERENRPGRKPAIEARTVAGSPGDSTIQHARNFLDCIKSRGKCNADILNGHLSTSTTLLGNIAHRTKSYLEWDANAERFTNNEAANRLLHYQYRTGYKLA